MSQPSGDGSAPDLPLRLAGGLAPALGSNGTALTPGEPWPLGAHCDHDGTNFAVFSRHAMLMELWVFRDANAKGPSIRVVLDRILHRTGDIWHARLNIDLRGQCYLFRAVGPSVTDARFRFDPHQLLLDPYAALIAARSESDAQSADLQVLGECRGVFAGIITDQRFDWQGDFAAASLVRHHHLRNSRARSDKSSIRGRSLPRSISRCD